MKKGELARWVRVGLLVVAVLLLANGGAAWAEPLSGDYCYTVRILETEDGQADQRVLLRLRSAALDNEMSGLHGYILQPGDNPIIVSGIANQVGTGAIYGDLNWTYIQKSTAKTRAGVMQLKLNATTRAGTFFLIYNKFNPADATFGSSYMAGTATPRTCP